MLNPEQEILESVTRGGKESEWVDRMLAKKTWKILMEISVTIGRDGIIITEEEVGKISTIDKAIMMMEIKEQDQNKIGIITGMNNIGMSMKMQTVMTVTDVGGEDGNKTIKGIGKIMNKEQNRIIEKIIKGT